MAESSENIVFGGPIPKNGLESCETLGELFLRRLQELGDSVLLINGITGEKITAAQIRERSIYLAQVLKSYGIKKGDILAIYSENQPEYVYLLLANYYLGTTLVSNSLYLQHSDAEYKGTIDIHRPKILFCAPSIVNKFEQWAKELNVEQLVVLNDVSNSKNIITYKDFINKANVVIDKNFTWTPLNMDTTVTVIIVTSGTTSAPKSVQLTHTNMHYSIIEFLKRKDVPEPLILTHVGWVRPFGLRILIRHMMHNIPTIFLPCADNIPFLEAIQTLKPNTVYLYVSTINYLLTNPIVNKYDLSSVKLFISCSAVLEVPTKYALQKKFGCPSLQGYGMSEIASIADQTDNNQKDGSVGLLRRGLYGKVADLKTGIPLGPNKRGELQFKGPTLMLGYKFNEVETRNAIDKDGWLHTGDYGYYDNDNEWFICDRIKDLILYDDIVVSPFEIETILESHPNIIEALVIGKSDIILDGKPVAYVLTNDSSITKEDVLKFINGKVTKDQHIYGVEFIKKSSREVAGKKVRAMLRTETTRKTLM